MPLLSIFSTKWSHGIRGGEISGHKGRLNFQSPKMLCAGDMEFFVVGVVAPSCWRNACTLSSLLKFKK
jgi:hypothetical protein